MIRLFQSEPLVSPVRGLLGESPESLKTLLGELGEPGYRATQILEWVYQRGAESYESMSNLPKALRAKLADVLPIFESETSIQQGSQDGTIKRLLRWKDGTTSECVLIPDADRRTACISTQVGCPVRCVFCASGIDGLERNLTPGQIIEQAMRARQTCAPERLSNIVFMGLGEPLANYEATVHALRILNAPWGMGIGARKITISTVGLPDQMRRLVDEGLQITIALSLHAPTDDLRKELIPWAQNVPIESLIDAARYYFDRTGREITLEYVLLGGVNDAPDQARLLAAIAARMRCNVNLIAYNPVEKLPFERPSPDAVAQFAAVLRDRGVNTHIRRSRGLDIDGACGQLRRRHAGHFATAPDEVR